MSTDDRPEIPGYDVEEELGRGGMGIVYRVRRRSTGRVLALKIMLRGRGASFAELVRFRIEAEAMACLNHPNIVKIRDVGVLGGYPYFAMEYAARGSLRDEVARGPFKPTRGAELVRTLATAMRHAHERGMLHRDLKPANVLLMEDGTPIVTDFGLVKFANPVRDVSEMYRTIASVSLLDEELARFARELGARYQSIADATDLGEEEITRSAWRDCATRTGVLQDPSRFQSVQEFLAEAQRQASADLPALDGLTKTGAVMGSPNYMAPEQAVGDMARIGPHTDVYALGGILYELLTGRPPFRATSLNELLMKAADSSPTPPTRLVPEVSPAIEAICLKCLEKAPEQRYPSAAELAEDLSRFLDGYVPVASNAPINNKYIDSTQGLSNARTTLPPRDGVPTEGKTNLGTRTWWPFTRGGRGSRTKGRSV
ncbi:MAG: serine/threonine-protein kinase [Isosphaeraceae bacterium]